MAGIVLGGRRGFTISLVFAAVLSCALATGAAAQAAGQGAAVVQLDARSAFMQFEDGPRVTFVSVSRDAAQGTAWLSFAYREPDPGNPAFLVQVSGEGEIPAEAFVTNSSSARLRLITPASLPVSRCVIDETSGDVACEPWVPSTLDLTWVADGLDALSLRTGRVTLEGPLVTNSQGQLAEQSAQVTGTWDGRTAADLRGVLWASAGLELSHTRQGVAARVAALLASPASRAVAIAVAPARTASRGAFASLTGDGLEGFIRVLRESGSDVTRLRFGYAFPDPADAASTIFYTGDGEIPASALSIDGASAHVRFDTSDGPPVTRCLISRVVGGGGTITCAPSPSPVAFDLTWRVDGARRVRETSASTYTSGGTSTSETSVYNEESAGVSGVWQDAVPHAGIAMPGQLTDGRGAVANR